MGIFGYSTNPIAYAVYSNNASGVAVYVGQMGHDKSGRFGFFSAADSGNMDLGIREDGTLALSTIPFSAGFNAVPPSGYNLAQYNLTASASGGVFNGGAASGTIWYAFGTNGSAWTAGIGWTNHPTLGQIMFFNNGASSSFASTAGYLNTNQVWFFGLNTIGQSGMTNATIAVTNEFHYGGTMGHQTSTNGTYATLLTDDLVTEVATTNTTVTLGANAGQKMFLANNGTAVETLNGPGNGAWFWPANTATTNLAAKTFVFAQADATGTNWFLH
jgi:hypothetical protein